MKRRRLLFITGLLGAAILLIVLITNRKTAKLDVLYCGHTNENQVVFRLVNGGQAPLIYWIGLNQVKSNGAWPRPHITPDDGVVPTAASLAVAAETNVVVDAPTNNPEWRLPVFWQPQGKNESLVGIVKFNFRLLKMWWPRRRQASRPKITMRGDQLVHTAYSITVTNQN